MKFNITSTTYLNRRQKLQVFAKWFLYSLSLIIVFMIMTSGIFESWQPFLMLPLATAIAMHEGELNSSIFATFCGLLMDIATGKFFGFSAIIMLPAAMLTTLLARNLIRSNIINHLWLTAAACLALGGMQFLFEYIIWDYDGQELIFKQYIFPSYASPVLLAPLFFLLIKWISATFMANEKNVNRDTTEKEESGHDK
ncbi:MAG: hypothetical protein LBR74_06970 [Eubacterium sp.]|jgi:rod shape-determining protein MreD|nr:hypothetical protein [Eubacterium sp.]